MNGRLPKVSQGMIVVRSKGKAMSQSMEYYGSGHRCWGSRQVPKEHYFTEEYLGPERFLGLQAQLHACLELGKEETFLEIGPGPGLLAAIMRHLGFEVLTMDLARELCPDLVARLPELPFRNRSFDVLCAFEVLEHLPFELLGACLREMGRVAAKKIVLTVPDQTEIKKGMLTITIKQGNRRRQKSFGGRSIGRLANPREHYWEVGFQGVSPRTVLDIGRQQGLIPIRTYFVSPWFRFFVFQTTERDSSSSRLGDQLL
jgi:ubiquinone/menaquinone biosynthesis C-methylase UbiE